MNCTKIRLPNELWCTIYLFDTTYKYVYDQCMKEMNARFTYNRNVCMLNSLFLQNKTSVKSIKRHMKMYIGKLDLLMNILNHYTNIYFPNDCCIYCKSVKKHSYVQKYYI